MSTRHPRIKMVLPVRIKLADGARFAHTLDVSRTGARLSGLHPPPTVGEEIEVHYQNRKARYRVVWVGTVGKSPEPVLGIASLEPQKEIWGIRFPEGAAASEPAGRFTRGQERFTMAGRAEVRALNGLSGVDSKLRDVSLGGCYCYTAMPYPVFTRVSLVLRIDSTEVAMFGVVRRCDAHSGMGIQFTASASEADQQRLAALIQRLEVANYFK